MFGPTFRRNLRWVKRIIVLGMMLLLFVVLGGFGLGIYLLPQPDPLTPFEYQHLGAAACTLWGFNIAMYAIGLEETDSHSVNKDLAKLEMEEGLRRTLFIIALGSTAEELLFRGLLLSILVWCGSLPAILISSVLFALVHRRLGHLGADVGVGILLGILAVQHGLIFAILAHVGFNFFVTGLHKVLDRVVEAK